MLKTWQGILAAACLVCISCGQSDKPVDIYPEEDICETCRMLITDQRFAAEIIPKKGKSKKFDDPICMVRYLDLCRKLDLGFTREDVLAYYVKDYFTREWVPAEHAVIVKANIVTVMGYGVCCFKDEGMAESFAKEHKGEAFEFEDLWNMYKEPNAMTRIVINNGQMMPDVVQVNYNDIVEILAEAHDGREYRIGIKGYEDLVLFDTIRKGHPRQTRFTAERPGRDFMFVDLDTGKPLGKFWVEGGHFREEQKRR
ncbi:MAG: nitrous oxide reductase accessory protein NosL [Desulfomonilia bacterium]|jgi:copper chaperone NosL|nr:nitrous oxide reductase accessory protein NosL [Desulfomonilia bacterium]